MTFFTHDQAIKAITFQYPTLKHGIDYLVVMKVQSGRGPVIPLEDAQIAWWDATETHPTIESLENTIFNQ